MKPINYNEVRWSCPQCRTDLTYVAYTAFNCHNCGKGWGIRRLLTIEEMKEPKTPMHEDEYL